MFVFLLDKQKAYNKKKRNARSSEFMPRNPKLMSL